SQTSNASSMIESWLKQIYYEELTSGVGHVSINAEADFTVYTLSGRQLMYKSKSIDSLNAGIYIINGAKNCISR
ncbi:MAG: hypothetical protein K2M67_03315, partial [Muribaculaceae bacterium]|nr:hypothetical protein [Muribaculaceae bacterium]